jgi:A/G-specific adenine glycosylase
MQLSEDKKRAFHKRLMQYYTQHGRHELPWRTSLDPYSVVVSELMLQQTQVGRVIPKYEVFLRRFPDFKTLAAASLGEVLTEWQGLGYNRRAKFLWQAAHAVTNNHNGKLPNTLKDLVKLPGIGPNTAGAILAYAFNKPAIFIETNIRTVYIHEFFKDQELIDDKEIRNLLEQTLPIREGKEQPDEAIHSLPAATIKTVGLSYREFYWALMDYGTHLKQAVGNHSARSKQYVRQSRFEGSRRQLRGAVIRMLSIGPQTEAYVLEQLSDIRTPAVLADLVTEGMVEQTEGIYRLA